MCDACRSLNLNPEKINGQDRAAYQKISNIYGLSPTETLQVSLCYFHDVELFTLGEKRFMEKLQDLKRDIMYNKSKYTNIRHNRPNQ
ncbi:MAG: hypothetical protein HOE90_25015 [Bacteriovoracaceae bacterium]|jgi:hypothetical protein|nr:hypothetical protein [Bacteriovoracaceae bacterium]